MRSRGFAVRWDARGPKTGTGVPSPLVDQGELKTVPRSTELPPNVRRLVEEIETEIGGAAPAPRPPPPHPRRPDHPTRHRGGRGARGAEPPRGGRGPAARAGRAH